MLPATDTPIPTLEIYKLQSARFTNLNDTLYRVPPIFGTVIGGLWYFAAQPNPAQRFIPAMAFALAGLVGWTGVIAVRRLTGYMNAYLNNLAKFEAPHTIARVPGLSTAGAILGLLSGSILLSVVGAMLALTRYH